MEDRKLKKKIIRYKISRALMKANRKINFKNSNKYPVKKFGSLVLFGRNSQKFYAEVLRAKNNIVILRVLPRADWEKRLRGGCGKKPTTKSDGAQSTQSTCQQNEQASIEKLFGKIESNLQSLQKDLSKMKYYCSPEDLLNFCRVLKRLQTIVSCFCELKKGIEENGVASKYAKTREEKPKKEKKRTKRKKDKTKNATTCCSGGEKVELITYPCLWSYEPPVWPTMNYCSPEICGGEDQESAIEPCKEGGKSQNKASQRGLKSESCECKKSSACEASEKCGEAFLKTNDSDSSCESPLEEQCCETKESKKSKNKCKKAPKNINSCSTEKRGKGAKSSKPRKEKKSRDSGCGCDYPGETSPQDETPLVTIYKAPPAIQNFCRSCYGKKVRAIKKNLGKELLKSAGKTRGTIFLKISAVGRCRYHIQLVDVKNKCLGCLYVEQGAMDAAIKNKDLEKYVTLSLTSPSDSFPDVRNMVKYPFLVCK